MSLPEQCIKRILSEGELLSSFIKTLEYRHIRYEKTEMAGNLFVQLTGYSSTKMGGAVSCFFMLSLLVYSHLLSPENVAEKEKFLRCMIIYPCYFKLLNLFRDDVEREKILKNFGMSPISLKEVFFTSSWELQEQFNKFVSEYNYNYYVDDNMVIQQMRKVAEEGWANCRK